MADTPTEHMQCMEVWGGSQLTSRGVELGGLEAWVFSKPYGEAQRGGDVYYASSCATGRITRLLLADVAGHGNAVAATAADLRTLMRRFVNRLDQTEFVRLLNQQFAGMSKDGTFATAVVTTFFAPSRRLTVCNAGHPRPLLYRAAQQQWTLLGHQGPVTKAKPQNIPLGMFDFAEPHLDPVKGRESKGTVDFLLLLAFLWSRCFGRWKRFYAIFFAAQLLITASGYVANVAINKHVYYPGSWYDVPLSVALAAFTLVGLFGFTLAGVPAAAKKSQTLVPVTTLGMLAVLSLPVMGAWAVFNRNSPAPVTRFRELFTRGIMLVMTSLVFAKLHRMRVELAKANQVLQETSTTDPLTRSS